MSATVLRFLDYPRTPWKNGSGSTRQVAAAPPGSGLADFDWRVSIADVGAEGPFSVFPGVDRVIMLIDGPGMLIAVDGTEHRLAPFAPFAFSGHSTVSCRLPGGPTRDVNVMTRRDRATASVKVADVFTHRDIAAHCGETLLVLLLSGQLALSVSESGERALDRLDAVRQQGPGDIRILGHGTVAEIRIGHRLTH
ncbi:HutD/Ves family protein [Actinacidiphila soli]|uniref:HutD/Ves family protein n=1 Tax=Actinacidiphila soli TaxID=2487275 RepID=UPI000FC9C059|nr:HutD family protein [Actinacidiphila soli]